MQDLEPNLSYCGFRAEKEWIVAFIFFVVFSSFFKSLLSDRNLKKLSESQKNVLAKVRRELIQNSGTKTENWSRVFNQRIDLICNKNFKRNGFKVFLAYDLASSGLESQSKLVIDKKQTKVKLEIKEQFAVDWKKLLKARLETSGFESQ